MIHIKGYNGTPSVYMVEVQSVKNLHHRLISKPWQRNWHHDIIHCISSSQCHQSSLMHHDAHNSLPLSHHSWQAEGWTKANLAVHASPEWPSQTMADSLHIQEYTNTHTTCTHHLNCQPTMASTHTHKHTRHSHGVRQLRLPCPMQ